MVLAAALSGGVDSSVAAMLLRPGWPEMVGASHVIWPGSRCCTVEVLQRAREVCRRLEIPYLQVDLVEAFRTEVVGDFLDTYLEGRTPNPCVVCNRAIRFDRFYQLLVRRLRRRGMLPAGEPLRFATGHYARVVRQEDRYCLARGRDRAKDQSYMLAQVRPEMLPNLVLPLGERLKSEIVELAGRYGLDYRGVPESQDACFVDGDYVEFIHRHSGREDLLQPGPIVDPAGRVLGTHAGAIHYTVGQRRGLGLSGGPWYVQRLEPERNRVVVARRDQTRRGEFSVERANWFIPQPRSALQCAVKLRYRSAEVPCTVEPEGEGFRVVLRRGEVVSPGQSAVFYDGELVLGGAIIA